MRTSRTLTLGIVLFLLGAAGLFGLAVVGTGPFGAIDSGDFASAGERIYYTGVGDDGEPIPKVLARGRGMAGGMMGSVACVDCHGEDGRGGEIRMMMGRSIEVPDIRYSTLTSAHTEDGDREPGWTDEDIADAVREGVEPGGERLQAPMPRWDMTDAEITAVIDYLKELD